MQSSLQPVPDNTDRGILTHRIAMELALPDMDCEALRRRIEDLATGMAGVYRAAYSSMLDDVIVVEFDPGRITARDVYEAVCTLCPVRRKVQF